MLSLTDTAVTTMKRLATLNKFSETAGLRITAGRERGEDLAVEFAVEAEPKDEVHDINGVQVFVDPAAARLLERITLDFEISPAGRFTFCFIIRLWPPEGLPPAILADESAPAAHLAPREVLPGGAATGGPSSRTRAPASPGARSSCTRYFR